MLYRHHFLYFRENFPQKFSPCTKIQKLIKKNLTATNPLTKLNSNY